LTWPRQDYLAHPEEEEKAPQQPAALKQLTKRVVERVLEAELTAHVGYTLGSGHL